MFIHGDRILSSIESYRFCWIAGRTGGHKTSLSLKIFNDYFAPKGYRLITNNQCIWADDPSEVDFVDEYGHLKVFVDFDEGGRFFQSSAQVKLISAYVAKMDVVMVFPSYYSPPAAARIITLQNTFSMRSAGIPAIFYIARIDCGGWHDKDWFIWLNPQEVYGIYSRQDPGGDPANIVRWLLDKTASFQAIYGREETGNIMEQMEVSSEAILADVTESLQGTAEAFETVAKRINRKRR